MLSKVGLKCDRDIWHIGESDDDVGMRDAGSGNPSEVIVEEGAMTGARSCPAWRGSVVLFLLLSSAESVFV